MMIHYLYFDQKTGQGVSSGSAYSTAEVRADVPAGCGWITTDERVSPKNSIVDPKPGLLTIQTIPDPPDYAGHVRAERDRLLQACDWTMGLDGPENTDEWKAYRQALRDLPQSTKDMSNPQWPEKPPAIFKENGG